MPVGETVFIDTNVVLYALGTEEPKRSIAQDALNRHPILSVQVLSEAGNVLHRKYGIPKAEVVIQLETIVALVDRVVPLEVASLRRGWDLWERYSLAWFDSLILASALTANCQVLYSEDFQHGQKIEDQLTILNPFVAGGLDVDANRIS